MTSLGLAQSRSMLVFSPGQNPLPHGHEWD
jgi:hypothetical protein